MSPGNAILLNGVMQFANREIGVPGFQPIRFVPSVLAAGIDNSSLLESLFEETQQIVFVEWNGTVVEKPSHRGRHL